MKHVDIGCQGYRPAARVWDRLIARVLESALAAFIHSGSLRVITSIGDVFTVGDGSGKPLAIRFASIAAQLGVLFDPDLRFDEAYAMGQ